MVTPSFYLNFNAESCSPYHNDDVSNDRAELLSGDGSIGDTVWSLSGHKATVTETREMIAGTTRLTTSVCNNGDAPLLLDCLSSAFITGIGAVFDFYAGTKKRPAQWMIDWGLEWLGRLISDPKRLWKRENDR